MCYVRFLVHADDESGPVYVQYGLPLLIIYIAQYLPGGGRIFVRGHKLFPLFIFALLVADYNLLSAVTLRAGVQWGEAFDFVEKHGQFMVGGSPSVGAGRIGDGWRTRSFVSFIWTWYATVI